MHPISFTGSIINILYSNDWHANANNVKRFKTVSDLFIKENKKKNPLIVAGGDICMDSGLKLNTYIQKAMKKIRVQASSMGNHDFEGGNYWVKALKKSRNLVDFAFKKHRPKFLSANLTFTRESPMAKQISKSAIIKAGKEKVGIIGVSPFDYGVLTFNSPFNDFIKIENLETTKKLINQEIQDLNKKGVNKIVILAHTGKESLGIQYYNELAELDGVNAIIGGHDHMEYDLWHKTKSGRNVKIVSAGKSADKNIAGEGLDSFGKLKLVFDDYNNLIPEQCKNDVELTSNYPISKKIEKLEAKYLQTNKIIGHINKDLICKNRLIEENPVGSLSADAMLWVINKETKGEKAQIAFVNAGTIREDILNGPVTIGSIKQALPFNTSTLIKTKLTKKQIFDTLNWGVESTKLTKISPGVMQVGGMRYTIGLDNKVKDVYLLDKNGSLLESLDSQLDNKEYTVAYDNFLMTGVAGLSALKKDSHDLGVEYFPYSRQEALIEYVKNGFKNQPIQIKTKRIELET